MKHNPDLTSSELSSLWGSYMADSLNVCVMTSFLTTVEDKKTEEILRYSKECSEKHLGFITNVFDNEDLPIPKGYDESDYNEKAPRLFSDTFYLRFLEMMGRQGMSINGMALGTCYRKDVREFYFSILKEAAELYNKTCEIEEDHGTLVRSPYIPYPKNVEFIEDTSFLSGMFTTHKRPLLAPEMNHLSNNIETNYIGAVLVEGFAQVTKSEELKKHLQEGYKLSYEIIKTFEKILEDNHSDTPFSSDSVVTDSTDYTFSDKLIMGLTASLVPLTIGNFGFGMGASLRSDLVGEYSKLIAKVLKYGDKGAKISIKNKWLEKPPQTLDREKLQNQS